MKCIFLYNPNSGRGTIGKKLRYIKRKLASKYDTVDLYQTETAQDLERAVGESVGKYDAIVFSGGDGTFNNVLQGLGGREARLGYLPTGTTNDVARSLRIPRSVRGALRVILKGKTEKLDVMLVNGERYVMYIAAAGAFTSATYRTPQKSKKAVGYLAYAFEGIKNNLDFQVFPITAEAGREGVKSPAVLVLVMNGKSVAGFPINREGSMTDGSLEVAIIKQARKPNFFEKIRAFFSVATLFAFGCKIRKRDIVYLDGDRVKIKTTENVVWNFDGEEGIRGNVTIEVLPRRLELFTPKRG